MSSTTPQDSAGTPPPATRQPGIPEKIGRFLLRRQLGAGGMGVVYLAEDPKRDRLIALKVLASEKADNPTMLKRFRAEALATRELRHENIVGVYEAGMIRGQFYIALEYIDGTDVARLVANRGRLPVKRSIDITRQVARALQEAHAQNIVHRDIKPSNLLIRQDGTVKLTDMGLARSLDETAEAGITRAGTTVGTVDYIAPEQARDSKAADVRSDIYSLGCTWYHMLTGQTLFPHGTLSQKLQHHASTPPPDPRLLNDAIPEDVVVVLERMLSKKAEHRYQDPADLLEALDAIDLHRTDLTDNILAALAEDADEPVTPPPPSRPGAPPDTADTFDAVPANRTPQPTPQPAPGQTSSSAPQPKPDSGPAPISESMPASTSRPRSEQTPQLIPPREPRPPLKAPARTDSDAAPSRRALPPRQVPPSKRSSTDESRPSSLPGRRKPASDAAPPVEPRRSRSSRTDSRTSRSAPVPPAEPPPASGTRRRSRREVEESQVMTAFSWQRLQAPLLVFVGVAGVLAIAWFLRSLSESVEAPNRAGPDNLFTAAGEGGDNSEKTLNVGPGQGEDILEDPPPADPGPVKKKGAETPNVPKTVPPPELAGPAKPTTPPLPLLRQGEDRHLPPWVLKPAGGTLPVLEVGGQRQGRGQFASLDAALAALPESGGQIRLAGRGPYFLSATTIADKAEVVIAGEEGGHSLVLLRPGKDPLTDVLTLRQSSLRLERINLVVPPDQFDAAAPLVLISVDGGDLSLHDCSLTQPVEREAATIGLRVVGSSPGRPSRVLLDRVCCRGIGLTALELDLSACDAAVVNSLLLSGSAPVVRLLSPPSASGPQAGRTLRFVSTTARGDETLVYCRASGSGVAPPPTRLHLVNSIFTAGTGDTPVLVDLGNWPQSAGDRGDAGRFQSLEWQTISSMIIGYRQLIRLDPDSGLGVGNVAEWQRCWSLPGDEVAFQPGPWPKPVPVGRPWQIKPRLFDTSRLKSTLVAATDGNAPGCRVQVLPTHNLALARRGDGLIARPSWLLPAPASRPLVRITLTPKFDLGQYLTETPPPDGAVLEVEGAGRHTTSPIRLNGRSLRIVLKQVRGAPLVLAAKAYPRDQLTTLDGYPAMFSVSKGRLELEGGRFEIPDSTDAIPEWFLRVRDASFQLDRCSVLGPRSGKTRLQGLIDWGETSASSTGHEGRIGHSFLVSDGTLLRSGFRRRRLLVCDSLLVSLGTLFRLDILGDQPTIDGAIDIRRSSLSATDAYFVVETAFDAKAAREPLNLYIDETVFAPGSGPMKAKPASAVLVSCGVPALNRHDVAWWGRQNGFTPLLGPYLQDRNADGTTGRHGNLRNFNTLWRGRQRLKPLHGKNGVILKQPLPERSTLRPSHFALAKSCRATTWGPGFSTIGANVAALDRQLGNVGPPHGRKGAPDF